MKQQQWKVLNETQTLNMKGGIVGGTEASPGQFPYQISLRNGATAAENEYPWQVSGGG